MVLKKQQRKKSSQNPQRDQINFNQTNATVRREAQASKSTQVNQ